MKTKSLYVSSREASFHDAWAESIDIDKLMVDETFEACTSIENRLILNNLKQVKNKRILELGCGPGEASIYFAKKEAHVTASDISEGMLNVVKKAAEKFEVSVDVKKMYSHEIDFDDETFDVVYASNLLHHVDIDKTLAEVKRVLKKGGVFVSWDPLAYNPVIKIYRYMARKVRTEDEHPIKMRDIDMFKKHFSKVETHTTWFFTLWIFMRFYLIERVDPSVERYWRRVIREHKRLEPLYNRLERMDKIAFRMFPFIRKFCWNIVIFSYK